MINTDQAKSYLSVAADLGLDMSDDRKVRDFIQIIRFQDAKLKSPGKSKKSDMEICAELGIPDGLIAVQRKSEIWRIATQVVLAEFLTDSAREDMRNTLFSIYQEGIPLAMLNVMQIAQGRVVDEEGKLVTRQPSYTAQVQAFTAIIANPMAEAWLSNTFMGEQSPRDEEEHIKLRDGLKRTASLQLDAPIEGEVQEVLPESVSVTPEPLTAQPVDSGS